LVGWRCSAKYWGCLSFAILDIRPGIDQDAQVNDFNLYYGGLLAARASTLHIVISMDLVATRQGKIDQPATIDVWAGPTPVFRLGV
jgi:hypothetical protein